MTNKLVVYYVFGKSKPYYYYSLSTPSFKPTLIVQQRDFIICPSVEATHCVTKEKWKHQNWHEWTLRKVINNTFVLIFSLRVVHSNLYELLRYPEGSNCLKDLELSNIMWMFSKERPLLAVFSNYLLSRMREKSLRKPLSVCRFTAYYKSYSVFVYIKQTVKTWFYFIVQVVREVVFDFGVHQNISDIMSVLRPT